MSTNKVSAVFSDQEKTEVMQLIASLGAKMPFLISLTAEERKRSRTMGAKSVDHVNRTQRASKSFPQVIPQSIDLVEFEKDLILSNQIQGIILDLTTLLNRLQDTSFALGSDLMLVADLVYGALKAAGRTNPDVKAAIAEISPRYKGQGRKGASGKSV